MDLVNLITKSIRMKRFLAVFCILFISFSGISQDTVTFLPHWLPQAQFAGYYMAVEKGFYENHGIHVDVLFGGPNFPVKNMVNDKEVDFCSDFLSGGIKNYCNLKNIVNIGQLSNRSALMFIARKSSGIEAPEDFNAKKIGIWRSDFQELPLAFLRKFNIEAEIIPITSTVNLFLLGGIDIMCVMWYNEYHQVINSGIEFDELNTFFFTDYDLDYPEDGIYCKRSFYNQNPDLCKEFLKATFEGWKYAFDHKNEAIDYVIKHMRDNNVPANRAHQLWMLNRMQDIIDVENNVGELNFDDYMKTAEILLESKEIDYIPDFKDFYK